MLNNQCSAKYYCLMMMIISILVNVYQFHHSDPPILKDLVKSRHLGTKSVSETRI